MAWRILMLIHVSEVKLISIKSKRLQVDEDFIAAYQMNYGFTPDGEQADTTTTESNSTPTTFPDTSQTAKNEVRNIVSSLILIYVD